jgi:hypothetical protein
MTTTAQQHHTTTTQPVTITTTTTAVISSPGVNTCHSTTETPPVVLSSSSSSLLTSVSLTTTQQPKSFDPMDKNDHVGEKCAMEPILDEVPNGYGVMMQLLHAPSNHHSNTATINDTATTPEMTTTTTTTSLSDHSISIDTKVRDRHYPTIHPNCYAPSILQNVHLLYGGGSGTAVFGGYHPVWQQSIVMKHGGSKDTNEVFALITIATELNRRGNLGDQQRPVRTKTSLEAAMDMKRRIPEFMFVYLSRHHIRDRNTELWATLRNNNDNLLGSISGLRGNLDVLGSVFHPQKHSPPLESQLFTNTTTTTAATTTWTVQQNSYDGGDSSSSLRMKNNRDITAPQLQHLHPNHRNYKKNDVRRLRLIVSNNNDNNCSTGGGTACADGNDMEWSVGFTCVDIPVPHRIYMESKHNNNNDEDPIHQQQPQNDDNDVAQFFQNFGMELCQQEERHNWKVTLGQKWIGGHCPTTSATATNNMQEDEKNSSTDGTTITNHHQAENGADILTSGQLCGPLLDTLIHGIMSIMEDLDQLTAYEERHERFQAVQMEVEQLRDTQNIDQVTKMVDLFVGRCIIKNFHPQHGRFRSIRGICNNLHVATSTNNLYLHDEEQIPAHFLGALFQPEQSMMDVFVHPPASISPLDAMEHTGWYDILNHATEFCNTTFTVATDCIWTCGLTDAGLHNTFLSVERGLELFDLGEPGLEPRPAFLTKFLMSFFHTLGMESDGKKSWKKRFIVVHNSDGEERLALTSETEEKIPYLLEVFTITLDHIMEKIFFSEERVRKLMIKYVVLQLLSDASFCLQRWEAKGGGVQRFGERMNDPLEKWLWRSLWDIYMASYVHTHILLEEKRIEI